MSFNDNEKWKFVIHKNAQGHFHVAEEYYDDTGKVSGWSEGEILITENKDDLLPLLEKAVADLKA